jgi:hypothetical protein
MSRPTRTPARGRAAMAAAMLITCLALPATSSAQASRTWVSGTGDDFNPCSRTAPCKTFAGAISKTATGGEIDAQDPGGYGAVTITKSITIDGGGGQVASILAAGVNAVNINSGATSTVTLRNIRIEGIGGGLSGVKIFAAKTVHLENDTINNFTQNGVDFQSSVTDTRVTVDNVSIEDNGGAGVLAAPAAGGSGRVFVTRSSIDANGCGVAVGATTCGASAGNGQAALVFAQGTNIADNGTGAGSSNTTGAGIFAVGPVAAVIGGDTITGNTNGLKSNAGGAILSFGDNDVFGNTTDGSPTGSSGPKKALDTSRLWRTLNTRAKKLRQARAHRRHRHHRVLT